MFSPRTLPDGSQRLLDKTVSRLQRRSARAGAAAEPRRDAEYSEPCNSELYELYLLKIRKSKAELAV